MKYQLQHRQTPNRHILIIAIKGKRDIKIGMMTGYLKNSIRHKNSYLPLGEFQDALNIKLKEIDQAKN